jgi:hypothetical protein
MTIKGHQINGKATLGAAAVFLTPWATYVTYRAIEVPTLAQRQDDHETWAISQKTDFDNKIIFGLEAAAQDRSRIVEKIDARAIADKEWREQKLGYDRERWEQQQQWNNDAMIYLREIYRTIDKDK